MTCIARHITMTCIARHITMINFLQSYQQQRNAFFCTSTVPLGASAVQILVRSLEGLVCGLRSFHGWAQLIFSIVCNIRLATSRCSQYEAVEYELCPATVPNTSNRLFYLCAVTINDLHGSSNSGQTEMYLPFAERNDESVLWYTGTETCVLGSEIPWTTTRT